MAGGGGERGPGPDTGGSGQTKPLQSSRPILRWKSQGDKLLCILLPARSFLRKVETLPSIFSNFTQSKINFKELS